MYNCEILRMYDANSDGTIDMGEMFTAMKDANKTITMAEYGAVEDACVEGEGAVARMCPTGRQLPRSIMMMGALGLAIIYILTR